MVYVVAYSASASTGCGFTGEWWEAYSELLFLRARYYQPGTGRFINRDLWAGDVQYPMSLHSYAYASDNPVTYVDPLGLYSCITDERWPPDLIPFCLLFDHSSVARNLLYEYGIVTGLGIVGWQDAKILFEHWLNGSGETMHFGSRLVGLIERDTASLIDESRTMYLSDAAQQMGGKAGRLPSKTHTHFLSNATGIPAGYLSQFTSPIPYRISEEVYIALGGVEFARIYGGSVEEEGQGTYRISLRTDFAIDKKWSFGPNVGMFPGVPVDEIPENPPAEFDVLDSIGNWLKVPPLPDWTPRPLLPFFSPSPVFLPTFAPTTNLWSVYIPDEWGYAMEEEGYATPFLATGRWARCEELLAIDHNCDGWDASDIVKGPTLIWKQLPTYMNPALQKP